MQEHHDEGTLNFKKMKKIIGEEKLSQCLFPPTPDDSGISYSDSECYLVTKEGLKVTRPEPGKIKFRCEKLHKGLDLASPSDAPMKDASNTFLVSGDLVTPLESAASDLNLSI
ncbi:hypothetical protein Ciccas_012543 [Cichlidogyrus casuarinus]|uniref:Uncharacterized protein n=1 Tax=Cichlidogyrus casuarinus TaxID=1844966 RepID=A0ABD2PP28_9PLAT